MVTDDAPALIEMREIRKRFGGTEGPGVEALRNVSLKIHAGEFIAIVGASGSGKSTLMHLLGCLDRPTEGEFLFEGRNVSSMNSDTLAALRRDAFGFVFQSYNLIPTETAIENVEVPAIYAGVPAGARAVRARELLERLGLGDRLTHRPHQLSGGQQQRVSIARALMNGGRILLADEPTGALDSRSGVEVMKLLDDLASEGHTIILITHDRGVAARAQRVVEISDGQIISDSGGRESTLIRAPGRRDPGPQRSVRRSGIAGLQESLRAAWRVMALNRFRTALTLLGIVMGVASVIVMLGLSLGTRERMMAQIGAMGASVMYIFGSTPSGGGPAGGITFEDISLIAGLPHVSRVMPGMGNSVTLRYGSADMTTFAQGCTTVQPMINKWPVESGRFFTEEEDRSLVPVVVIGSKVRDRFFPLGINPLGKILLIDSVPFEVIGVMSEKGAQSGRSNDDEIVFLPISTAGARVWTSVRDPEYAVVEALSTETIDTAEKEIADLLLARHGRYDFSVSNPAAMIKAEKEASNTMMAMLAFTGGISLLVGGIGVMNVMLMSVRERTREIGIRMATGARQRDIQLQFLMETVLVSIVGGAAGVLLGLISGAVLIAMEVPLIFSIRALLVAFSCSAVTGLIFGFMPARRAARLDPVIALAGE